MSWETRNGNRYYYSAQRIGGRVVKRYIGHGEGGATLAAMDWGYRAQARLQRYEEQRPIIELMARLHRWERRGIAFCEKVDKVMRVSLLSAGYHQHKRGEWRKRRKATGETMGELTTINRKSLKVEDGSALHDAILSAHVPERGKEWAEALQAGGEKDASLEAVGLAIACVRKHPEWILPYFGKEIEAFLKMVAGGNKVTLEILLLEAEAKCREVSSPNPSPLETLLVERVVACWFQVMYFDQQFTRAIETLQDSGRNPAALKPTTDLLDGAQRRYLAAVKALAQVRRLHVPNVAIALPGSTQVNIGEKQVNVAQGGAVLGNRELAGQAV